MTGIQVIRKSLDSTEFLLKNFVSDLSDADLLVCPVPGANHIAWQLGHLIQSERQMMLEQLPSLTYPELPAGFVEAHTKETATLEPAKGFATKAVYLDLLDKVRAATNQGIDSLTDKDLDTPTKGGMAPWAPTLADFVLLVANHSLMHAGQFSVVRRKLGKPILF